MAGKTKEGQVTIKLLALGQSDEVLRKHSGKAQIVKGGTVTMPASEAQRYLDSGRWQLVRGKAAPADEGTEGEDGAAGNEDAK